MHNKTFSYIAIDPDSPFHYGNETGYQQWKKEKLTAYPQKLEQLLVPVKDPMVLSSTEIEQLRHGLKKANMAIYEMNGDHFEKKVKEKVKKNVEEIAEDKAIPEAIGHQLGIHSLDRNECADDDGFTSLQVVDEGLHTMYIPYSNKGINWHTDGYYNLLSKQIFSMLLHCVRPAKEGGENRLMDHEIAYMLLREQNPQFIRALMHPSAMTIPKNVIDGELIRPDRSGPVFMLTPQGRLHMRYTARARNVIWHDDLLTQDARQALREIFEQQNDYLFEAKLQSGQGLICNNLLHTRMPFKDAKDSPRLLYRGRYFDEINLN
jgi:alpha-ketoglutarate-dependent taurine dioxygenase